MGNHQSVGNMDGGEQRDMRKFFVNVEGRETAAQRSIIQRVKAFGQTEVSNLEECDYVLVFCPIVTRVAADISGALNNIPAHKPAILVVLHHTRNSFQVLAESKDQVHDPNVYLTLDFLFWDEELLDCHLNDEAFAQIQRLLPSSNQLAVYCGYIGEWLKQPKALAIIGGVVVFIVAVVLIVVFTRNNPP